MWLVRSVILFFRRRVLIFVRICLLAYIIADMDMGRVDSWIGLGWVGISDMLMWFRKYLAREFDFMINVTER